MITGTSKIGNILNQYPNSFDIFVANGFDFSSKSQFLDAVGQDTMLQTLLQVKDINLELFLFHLDNAVLKEEAEKKYLLEDFSADDKLDFYGNTICPLKFTFRDALEEMEKENISKNNEARKCYLEFGKMVDDTCEESWTNPNPETFPNLMFTKELNEYLGHDFQKNMAGMFTGNFYEDRQIKRNPKLVEAGLVDPENMYNVYAVMAETFMIDKKRLGNLPIPRTLEDLLNPIYKDNIIIFGKDGETLSNAIFLYIYKLFGDEGIKKFAHNVKHALHGSVMSKTAGSTRNEGGAIYLVSWFFAQTCVRDGVEIIWPDDGAVTLPMYMLVRKDGKDKVQDLTDYIIGEDFANACIKAYTPAMNGNVTIEIPNDGSFQWLGWDFIRKYDLQTLADHCISLFLDEWRQVHPEGVLCP